MTFTELLIRWNGGKPEGVQSAFAKHIGVQQAAVSRWMAGKFIPKPEVQPRIAKELGVTVDQLLSAFTEQKARASLPSALPGGASATSEQTQMFPVQYVPVLGVVSAENFHLALEQPPDEVLPIPVMGANAGKYFSLRVSGRCMEPTVHDGHYVVVAQATEIPDGKLGVFRLNGECTLKRLFRMKDGSCELRPDNPKFQKLIVDCGSLKVVGLVIGFFQKP